MAIETNQFGIPRKSGAEIRSSFVRFFTERQHLFVPSSPVVVHDDPTLLFTNSGMNQFKQIFLGDNPKGLTRAVNSQKCLRVSGKHNDLEEVGADGTHHTFFEMLGNWSFGDYFKKEAIEMAWELLTVVWKFPKSRLFVTVHKDDREAPLLWEQLTDIDPKRILRFEKENFWEMGEVGPCGPSSEIFFDLGPDHDRDTEFAHPTRGVNGKDAAAFRFVEIWNLVFMQFERKQDQSLVPLKQTHVDTGSGLERVSCFIQGVTSNYETDLFWPIIQELVRRSGVNYTNGPEGMAHRVVADHIRTLTFAIADGVTPSNEGRGYVIRRILRRASRYGRKLGLEKPFLFNLVDVVVAMMGEAYPEILTRASYIREVIQSEEERFVKTLGDGLHRFEKSAQQVSGAGKKTMSGREAFTLFDTFGFPLDLTQLLARERGLEIDLAEYDTCMREQRARAKAAHDFADDFASDHGWTIYTPGKVTEYLDHIDGKVSVTTLRYLEKKDEVLVLLTQSPFYAEGGGQVGDRGFLRNADVTLRVLDTFKVHEMHVHRCALENGLLSAKTMKQFAASIDQQHRDDTTRHHSVTHLLHAALRQILGPHVTQQGSRVGPDLMRFDFTHPKGVSLEELEKIENLVNVQILADEKVHIDTRSLDQAKSEGALAMFGEKYGDVVRVVSMGSFSKELCGGSHVSATGRIGIFRILSESSIAAGVRRIEAVSGFSAQRQWRLESQSLAQCADLLKVRADGLLPRLQELLVEQKKLEKRLGELQLQHARSAAKELVEAAPAKKIGELTYRLIDLNRLAPDKTQAQQIFDQVSQLPQGGAYVGTFHESEQTLVFVSVGESFRSVVQAGQVLKSILQPFGGKGGGKAERAQGILSGTVKPEQIWQHLS